MRLIFLLVVATVIPAFGSENVSSELRFRSYRNWSVSLPAEQWFKLNDGIRIKHAGGDKFAVKLDGERLQVDTNGDGKIDRTIKALVDRDTNVSTSRVILKGKSTDGKPLQYAVRLRKDAAGWEWAPGGAMIGTLDTKSGPVPVRVIDQNGNGRFDDVGQDAMIVGTGDNATYLSETVLIGSQLKKFTITADGSQLSTKPFEGKTAQLDLTTSFDAKAVLLAAIVRSKDGKNSFDVASMKGAVTVPSGTYEIVSGTVGLGTQRVTVKRGRMEPIVLAENATASVNWGGPVKSEFNFVRLGGEVQFSPDTVWFYGTAGEEYTGWAPCGKSPEFTVKDKETGQVIEVAILPGSC